MLNKLLLTMMALSVVSCAETPNTLNSKQQLQKEQRCSELRERIKKLEGKPVRRTTAREYYEKECL